MMYLDHHMIDKFKQFHKKLFVGIVIKGELKYEDISLNIFPFFLENNEEILK